MLTVPCAAEIMRRRLVTLKPQTDVFDGVTSLLRDNISGAPVIDGDGKYLGVFSEKCSIAALTEVVEAAGELRLHAVKVRDFMTTDLITLSPERCVFDAIDHLLSRRISGAPVTDQEGRYLGIFSEKTAMRVLVAALHDQLPGSNVGSYMNLDRNRIIDEEDLLLDVAHKFQATPYRRLPVLHAEKLAGQVSRRDVLRAEHRLTVEVLTQVKSRPRRSLDSSLLKAVTSPKRVEDYMDREALTARPGIDMLGIAQLFLNSPYRRLPIVEDGQLIGQVSRRDLLEAAAKILRPKKHCGKPETLYLSLVSDAAPSSFG